MESKIIIKTSELTKTYTDVAVPVHAVNHVNLEITQGEFTAIIGPVPFNFAFFTKTSLFGILFFIFISICLRC